MKCRPRLIKIFGFVILFALGGACIDVYYEWPERVPGDPKSSFYTLRHAAGIANGWIFYSIDDVFAHDNLKPGIKFSGHSPVLRVPAGHGVWWDFGIYGVAPWFISVIAGLIASISDGFWRKPLKIEQGSAGHSSSLPQSED